VVCKSDNGQEIVRRIVADCKSENIGFKAELLTKFKLDCGLDLSNVF
jgi:hypothetical protein